MLIASEGFAHLMAHSVTADAGKVASSKGQIDTVRLVFHYGWADPDEDADLSEAAGPVHDQRFVDPASIRTLIGQLTSLAEQLGV